MRKHYGKIISSAIGEGLQVESEMEMNIDKSPDRTVDRKYFDIVPVGFNDDEEYWLTRSVEERLEYIEYLREMNCGDEVKKPMQRFFEVVRHPR
jgi:hypothetical protein